MGRNREGKKEGDRIGTLNREIKDLKQENAKLKKLLREKEKIDKVEKKDKPVEKPKPTEKECPKCGAKIKSSELPMGYLELCAESCGYRAVTKKK